MRLATYDDGRGPRPALQRSADTELIDVGAVAELAGLTDVLGPPCRDITAILNAGPEQAGRLSELADKYDDRLRDEGAIHAAEAVTLLSPVLTPEKIICIGLNYHDHVAETGQALPKEPMFFGKLANSLIGHGATIIPPRVTSQVDYEAELAVVIGKCGSDIAAADALNYVAGVMPLNDVSARDLQLANHLWTGGKAIDTFAPAGPTLVLLDEISNIQQLPLKARVNNAVVQDSNTANMIFSVAELVSYLSRIMTLKPGDIIATGTPAGVAQAHGPMTFLRPGDTVEVDIEGVGVLRNPIGEPRGAPAQPDVLQAVS